MKSELILATVAGIFLALSPDCVAQAPPDFPLECHGAQGMASTSGKNLIIDFKISGRIAGPSLEPGSCAWRDRRFHRNEPARIAFECTSISEARNIAGLINAGNTWTFWVFNVGRFFRATASAKGAPKHKPISYDY